jgi:hypothetical protein
MRNINVTGTTFAARQLRREELIKRMAEQLAIAPDKTAKFVEWMTNSGWTHEDVESVLVNIEASDSEKYEQPLLVAITHHEKIFDFALHRQSVWSGGVDTAANPNPAIRHKAYVELFMRRQSYSDLILLQLAQMVAVTNGDYDRPSSQISKYWKQVYGALLHMASLNMRSDRADKFYQTAGVCNPRTAIDVGVGLFLRHSRGLTQENIVTLVEQNVNHGFLADEKPLVCDMGTIRLNFLQGADDAYRVAVITTLLAIDCYIHQYLVEGGNFTDSYIAVIAIFVNFVEEHIGRILPKVPTSSKFLERQDYLLKDKGIVI